MTTANATASELPKSLRYQLTICCGDQTGNQSCESMSCSVLFDLAMFADHKETVNVSVLTFYFSVLTFYFHLFSQKNISLITFPAFAKGGMTMGIKLVKPISVNEIVFNEAINSLIKCCNL